MTIRSLEPLYALSVHQPWASCIARGWKLVENRSWRPPSSVMGRELAIHATRRPAEVVDEVEARDLLARYHGVALPRSVRYVHGALVAVVRVVAVVTPDGKGCPRELRHWHVPGQYGWLLADVRRLQRPLEVRGQQGVWPVPGELVHLAREQLAQPRRSAAAAASAASS